MIIKSLRLVNFLSFGEHSKKLDFGSFNTIVGPNNSGKTNILRAISLVGQALHERNIERGPYHYKGDIDTPAEVEVGITLNDAELRAVSDFLTCISLTDDVRSEKKQIKERLENIRNGLVTRFYCPAFSELFQDTAIRLRFSNEDRHGAELALVLSHQNLQIYVTDFDKFSLSPRRPSSYLSKTFGQMALEELRSYDQDRFDSFVNGSSDSPPTAEIKSLSLERFSDVLKVENRTVVQLDSHQYGSLDNILKDKTPIISLRKFLLRRGYKKESVGELFNLRELFSSFYNSAIIRLSDMRSRPKAVQELKENPEFVTSRYTLMTGEELPEMLFALKNSAEPTQVQRYVRIAEKFRKLTGLSFDVAMRTKEIMVERGAHVVEAPTESEYGQDWSQSPRTGTVTVQHDKVPLLLHAAEIQILQDGFAAPLDFVAAGIVETLLLLTAIVGHSSKILLLDEPAQNLHPSMQMKIMDELGMVENQIFLLTHSPYFISGNKLENIWRLVMGKNGTEIINFGETIQAFGKKDRQKLSLKLEKPDVRALLFTRGVVFVEGPSDKIVLDLIDKARACKERTTLAEREWSILSVGSKSSLAAFIDLSTKMGVNFAAVLDNDALSEVLFSLTNRALVEEKDLKEKSIDELTEMVQKHGLFVFKKDLESALRLEVSNKESKPLKALQTVLAKIEDGKIPLEIQEMMERLDNHVNRFK